MPTNATGAAPSGAATSAAGSGGPWPRRPGAGVGLVPPGHQPARRLDGDRVRPRRSAGAARRRPSAYHSDDSLPSTSQPVRRPGRPPATSPTGARSMAAPATVSNLPVDHDVDRQLALRHPLLLARCRRSGATSAARLLGGRRGGWWRMDITGSGSLARRTRGRAPGGPTAPAGSSRRPPPAATSTRASAPAVGPPAADRPGPPDCAASARLSAVGGVSGRPAGQAIPAGRAPGPPVSRRMDAAARGRRLLDQETSPCRSPAAGGDGSTRRRHEGPVVDRPRRAASTAARRPSVRQRIAAAAVGHQHA